jgi:hypothetical protein
MRGSEHRCRATACFALDFVLDVAVVSSESSEPEESDAAATSATAGSPVAADEEDAPEEDWTEPEPAGVPTAMSAAWGSEKIGTGGKTLPEINGDFSMVGTWERKPSIRGCDSLWTNPQSKKII